MSRRASWSPSTLGVFQNPPPVSDGFPYGGRGTRRQHGQTHARAPWALKDSPYKYKLFG